MFKSITYNGEKLSLGRNYHLYHIIDSEFQFDINVYGNSLYENSRVVAAVTAPIIFEYKRRGKDIIHNIYLFNMFLLKKTQISFF